MSACLPHCRCHKWREQLDPEFQEFVMSLCTRTNHCFTNENINSFEDVMARTEKEWLRVPNFGRKAFAELKKEMHRAGHFSFGISPDSNLVEGFAKSDMQALCFALMDLHESLEKTQKRTKAVFETMQGLIDAKLN